MSILRESIRWWCGLLAAACAAATSLAEPTVLVSPGPTRLPASSSKFIRFHFTSKTSPAEPITALFEWNGSTPDQSVGSCRIQIGIDGSIVLAGHRGTTPNVSHKTPQSNGYCDVSGEARVARIAGGGMDSTVPVAFRKAGRFRLFVRTASSSWSNAGDYLTAADATSTLAVQINGVTPTQAVLGFATASDSDTCQVQVTATKNESGWDYSTLVPDSDPAIFRGADNANLYDQASAPGNRGFALPDGTRGIVIGKRAAEYSSSTYKMHSRALQAATPHQAWVTCASADGSSTASGTVDFSTATIMPGITYSDPLPADADRPGDYSYPTLSWTSRTDGAVDPQTGVMIRPLSLVTDSYLGNDFSEWKGFFGTPVPAYPARSLPANSVFLPATIYKALPDWLNLVVNQAHTAWGATDGSALMSFALTSLLVSCPQCSNTPITVCLTSDGISCAVDRNVSGDPAAAVDPNTKQRGVLGTTFRCTGNCSFPVNDERWKDLSPVLAAWHPNYSDGARTVLPNFQFDSVKLRTTPVKCASSAVVFRGTDAYGTPQGASFSPDWIKGTPLFIDSIRYTVNQVYDEDSLLLNESCPASAQTMTADTFGLLVSSPVPLNNVVADQWKSKIHKGLTSWDDAGDLNPFTNCSHKPVIVNGKTGWHCVVGYAAYWIAADGSSALPMGATGVPQRSDLGNTAYCIGAFWDDLDANSMYCVINVPNSNGKHQIVQMTFSGDHSGLENAQYTSPDLLSLSTYLPVCKSTNPPTPNNCWTVTVMKTTGTNAAFILEDAVRDGAPDAWKNSAFPAAMVDGVVYSYVSSKVDENHLMLTTGLGQNSYGFSSLIEYSTPRGSVRLRGPLPSWTAAPTAPAGTKSLRWSGIHNPGGVPWGPTKIGIFPTFFQATGLPGQGYYYSKIVSSAPATCPAGTSGACISVTVDGQPGVSSPSRYEPHNDAKTRKSGTGYLTDLAVGDLLCMPQEGDVGTYCHNFIQNGRFEHLRVVALSNPADGTVVMTLQRNVGQTVTMPLTAGQQLFPMPSLCDYGNGYGCSLEAVVWDWSTGSVDQFSIGGESHQFTVYDPVNNQVANVTDGSFIYRDPLCYSSGPNPFTGCYSVFGGKLDPARTVSSQIPTLFQGIVTMNPPFAVGTGTQGYTGVGNPNEVESHPGSHQMSAAPNSEKTWFIDGRPFNGIGFLTPPVQAAPDVYRFPVNAGSAAASLETYKRLPMTASCGINALREVTRISDQSPYSYCVAVSAGDCMSGSARGDAYVSCPVVKPSTKPAGGACPLSGGGRYTAEVRDTCLATVGPHTMGLTQVGFASQAKGIWSLLPYDRRFRSTRLVTHGFSRYRIVDPYWNPKTTPDGAVMLFRAVFLAGYSTQFLMAKLPPFPDITKDPLDRRSFVPTPAVIDPGPAGATSVKVQFGYDTTFRCNNRPEACEARADFDSTGLSTPFYFASERGGDGFSCDGGCPAGVNLPGISQRVVFYRAVYQVEGSTVSGPTRVTVVPDTVPVPGN